MKQFECVTDRVRIRSRPTDLPSAPRAAKPQVTCRRARAGKAAYTVERTAYTISWCGSDVEGSRPCSTAPDARPSASGPNAIAACCHRHRLRRHGRQVRLERLVGSIDGRSRAFKPRCTRDAERAGAHRRICSPSHPRLSPWLNSKMADPRLGKHPRQLRRPTSEAAEGKLAIEPPSGARHLSPAPILSRRRCSNASARSAGARKCRLRNADALSSSAAG